jgi:hemerythrin
MPLLKWHDIYSVNNETIDTQHKSIFNLLNKLYDSCISNTIDITFNTDADELNKVIKEHMATEEEYLKYFSCPYLNEHIQKHRDFIQIIDEKCASKKYSSDTCEELLVTVAEYILNHIIILDKKYSDWIDSEYATNAA